MFSNSSEYNDSCRIIAAFVSRASFVSATSYDQSHFAPRFVTRRTHPDARTSAVRSAPCAITPHPSPSAFAFHLRSSFSPLIFARFATASLF